MVWHPDLSAHAVHGPSFAKYVELRGSVWGYPLNDVTPTPDGRGTYLHVRNMDSGGDSGIYWTPETGANVVYGAIWAKWAPAGAERSLVGYPTGDEQSTGDDLGRYQVFENGIYVWHGDFGAWPVWGDILTRYHQIGGSDFGFRSATSWPPRTAASASTSATSRPTRSARATGRRPPAQSRCTAASAPAGRSSARRAASSATP